METLRMSGKERRRLSVMAGVMNGELSLAEGARVMKVSYRQGKRIWKRYQGSGDAGLVHQARGKVGSRQADPEHRQKVLARHKERYADFGPTLAAEYLAEEGLAVDHET